MKKIALLVLFLSTLWGYSQASSYSFSQKAGTYTEITGGVSLVSSTADHIKYVDVNYPDGGGSESGSGLPIGFNFVYNGFTYDKFGIHTCGYIGLGTSTLSPAVNLAVDYMNFATPLASTAAINSQVFANKISVLGQYLQGQAGSTLRYETSGNAPNRILTIQWKNYMRLNTSGSLNFQIKLYESSNKIEFVYGTMSQAVSTTYTYNVGLRAEPWDIASNFTNRTSAGSWDATTPGATAKEGIIMNDVVKPTSGLTYTWTPASCGSTKNLAVSSLTSNSATLNWSFQTPAPSGYQYVATTVNTLPTGPGTATTATTASLTDLIPNTVYYVFTRSVCGTDFSIWSLAGSFRTKCLAADAFTENFDSYTTAGTSVMPYCWETAGNGPTYIANGSDFPASAANRLKMEASSFSGNPLVAYAILPKVSTLQAETHRLKFKAYATAEGSATGEGRSLDVGYLTDRNDVNTFVLLEKVDLPSSMASALDFSIFPKSIPAGVQSLVFRFKGMETGTSPIYIDDVIWGPIPTCADVKSLAVDGILSTSAILKLTPGGKETAWQYAYGPVTLKDTSTLTPVDVTSLTPTITGLSPVTSYRVWVRASCGNGSYGAWNIPVDFTTTCTPSTGYTQNFDAATLFPSCWKKVGNSGVASPVQVVGAPSSPNALKIEASPTNGTTVIAMEPVSNYNTGTHRLKFKMLGSVVGATVQVGYLTNINDAGSFNLLQSFAATSTTAYGQANMTFGAAPTTPYLAFRVLNSANASVYIDDVLWEPIPSCPDMTDITLSKVAHTSADFTWKVSGAESQWQYVVGPATTTNPSTLTATDFTQAPSVFGSNVTASISGLTASTSYKIWLRSKCNSASFGVWLGPFAVNTTCSPITGFTQNFDSVSAFSLPSCWNKVAGTAEVANLAGAPSPSNVLRIIGGTNKGIVALLPVSNAGAGSHRLRFKFKSSVSPALLDIGYLMNPSDPTSFTVLQSKQVPSTTDFSTVIADLGSEPASQVLAFKNSSASGYVYIDDVVWEPLPQCDDVSGLKLNLVGSTSVDVSWTKGTDVSAWQYAVGVATLTDPSTLNPVDISSSTVTAGGLSPTTAYKLWVRSKCGTTTGFWAGPITFTTNCSTVTEFTQNFDVNTNLPSCWSKVGSVGSAAVVAYAGASSPNVLSIASTSATAQGMVAMQPVSNIAAGDHRLKFKLKGSAANATVEVGFLANPVDPSSFSFIQGFTASTTAFETKTFNIPADQKISVLAFRNLGNVTSTVYIDNVTWEPIPACADISAVAVNNTTSTSTNLSWITTGTGVTYQYAYGPATTTDPSALTPVNVASAQVALTELSPSTAYKVWVRTRCGETSFGFWSEVLTFSTTCAPGAEFTQNFDANTDIPACWRVVDAVEGVTITTKTGGSSPNALTLNSNASAKAIIALPSVSNINSGTHRLKFKFASSVNNGTLEVGYLSDINNPATFMALETYKATLVDTFESKTVVLGTNPPAGSTLAFRNPSVSYVYVDDVVWETKPSCSDLTNVLVKSSTSTSVELSWNAIGTETAWQYIVAPSTVIDPDTLPSSAIINTDVKALTISTLIPNTSYRIWVRSNCGNNVFGAWAEAKVFHTPCPSVETISENFDASLTLSDCWNKLTSNGSMAVVAYKGILSTNALEVKTPDNATAVFVAFPSLSTAVTGKYSLKFKYRANLANTKIEVISFKDLNNLDNESSYVVLKTMNVSVLNKVYLFNEMIPATTTHYLGLKVYNSNGMESIVYIDDFVWELPQPTTCATGIAITPDANCGNYSTAISWYSASNAIGYKLTIGTTSGGSDIMNNEDLGDVLSYSFTGKANTTYYFTVKPWNALGDATGCTVQTFTTAANNCYCPSVPSMKDGLGITHVKLGGANFVNPSAGTFVNHMSKPVNVAKDAKVNLTISYSTGDFNYHNNIWIDFNNNFQFEPTEIVYQGQGVKYGDFDASFNMPATATMGVHGMRIVSVRYEQFPADPCVSGPPGVTLDFKVNVVNPVSNDEPANATALIVGKEFSTNAIVGSIIDATASEAGAAPVCGNYNGSDVWYKAIVPASGKIIFELNTVSGGLADMEAAVYSGNTNALTMVSCDATTTKIVLTGRTAGEALYLRVWEKGGDEFGSFKVSAYEDTSDNPVLGMDNFEANNFAFYPNPVKDVINMTMNQEISSIDIFNLLGQQVINKSVNANQAQIDMSGLSAGTYLVRITADNQTKTIKLVKE